MQIRVPQRVADAWDRIHEWGYAPLWSWRWITVRRVDPLIAAAGIFCFAYYAWTGGWLAGITGLLAFVFIGMCALWLF